MITAPLSSGDLLRMWERAEGKGSAQRRALSVLSIACPQETWDVLSSMSIGRRDGHLLALRERLIGTELELGGECPHCGEEVELPLSTQELGAAGIGGDDAQGPRARHRLEHGDMEIDFRLPDSRDLEAASGCGDVEAARAEILDRCVLAVRGSGASGSDASGSIDLPGSRLPAELQDALEREMDRLDPLAVTRIDLTCPSCDERWQARFDISDVVLSELGGRARTLLRDVSTLARLYHWSEQSILEMSPRRRSAYLELAQS